MGTLSAVVVLVGCMVVCLAFLLAYVLAADARRLQAMAAADRRTQGEVAALRESALRAFHERQRAVASPGAG